MKTFFTALGLCAVLAAPAVARDIGVVASLEPSIEGTPPDSASRALSVGLSILADERVVSSATGRGQLLFNDQTTVTLAPNSEVVLDRFVYDPDRDTGEVAVTLTKGALRFIGGRITKKTDGVIKTPTATIGIRGGMALIELVEGSVKVIFLAGEYACLQSGTQRHCVQRPGGILTPEGYPGVADPTVLSNLLRLLDGGDGRLDGQRRLSVGSDDVGPADKPKLSTNGEERDVVIFEEDIRENLFNDRGIGRGVAPPPRPIFDECTEC